jgi:hypothetical protein
MEEGGGSGLEAAAAFARLRSNNKAASVAAVEQRQSGAWRANTPIFLLS